MNITSPILAGAAHMAELPGDSVASLLKMVGTGTGLFDDSPDRGLGLAMSALAGVADAQVELRTDRNQTLAQMRDAPARYRVF